MWPFCAFLQHFFDERYAKNLTCAIMLDEKIKKK